jgi:hypothetical protein
MAWQYNQNRKKHLRHTAKRSLSKSGDVIGGNSQMTNPLPAFASSGFPSDPTGHAPSAETENNSGEAEAG